MVKDFQVLVKNPNKIEKKGSNNESDTDSKLLTKLYTPLVIFEKESLLYDKLLRPSLR